MDEEQFRRELDEIERIDYLLDQLARAVEHGEVHRSSYDLLAPRYLERRAELVAVVTGVARSVQAARKPSVPPVVSGGVVMEHPRTVAAADRPAGLNAPQARVDWPTVLLFLGAFLVIVASAIFAVAVWGELGTLQKSGFLGTLTIAFYAGAWWSFTRLELRVGAVALASVASAMLLFDGWILIEGYGLSGPLPWAALLLTCSAVYWATEVLLAGRVFGVIGAAAQVAWWWLLGSGLGLTEPVRLAGIAIVALAWQAAFERGRARASVSSLASVLGWAAPAAGTASVAALVADLVIAGPADRAFVAAAALVALAAGLVLARSPVLSGAARRAGGVAAQVPFLAAAWSAAMAGGHAWWLVAAFTGAAVVYDVIAFRGGSLPFGVLGLAAEASAVIGACQVLGIPPSGTVVALSILAAVWALSARMLDASAIETLSDEGRRRMRLLVSTGAFVLMTAVSLALPVVTGILPLPGTVVGRGDVLGYVGVLAGWWACYTVRPRGSIAFAGSVWAFPAFAAIESLLLPADVPAAHFVAPLVALAGVWLASSETLQAVHGRLWQEATRWSARMLAAVLTGVGLLTAAQRSPYSLTDEGLVALLGLVALALVACVVFAADAIAYRCAASAAALSLVVVSGGGLIARAVGFGFDPGAVHAWAALGTGAGAVAATAVGALFGRRERTRPLARWAAVFAAAAASAYALLSRSVSWELVALWTLVALCWAVAAAVTTQRVAAAVGLSVVAAFWQLPGISASEPASVAVIGLAGFALGLPTFVRPFAPTGPYRGAGTALALAGVAAHAHLVYVLELPGHALAIAWLLLAVDVAAMSVPRGFEPGYYVSGAAIVAAAWVELGLAGEVATVFYTMPLALYLAAAGYLHVRLSEGRAYPQLLDTAAAVVGLGYPLLVALQASPDRSFAESLGVVVVSLFAIGAGVVLKVRWYFFGGVGALVIVALYRSFAAIAAYWWLVLGVVGVGLLVIALTWQRRRLLVSGARGWLARSFEGWR